MWYNEIRRKKPWTRGNDYGEDYRVLPIKRAAWEKLQPLSNLAAALSEREKRVLLCDFDPQGNATSGLGIDKQSLEVTITDAILGRKKLVEVTVPTEFDNLSLVLLCQP